MTVTNNDCNEQCLYVTRLERKFLKRKRYKIDVPMNFYHFEEVDMEMQGRVPREAGATGLGKSCDKVQFLNSYSSLVSHLQLCNMAVLISSLTNSALFDLICA